MCGVGLGMGSIVWVWFLGDRVGRGVGGCLGVLVVVFLDFRFGRGLGLYLGRVRLCLGYFFLKI